LENGHLVDFLLVIIELFLLDVLRLRRFMQISIGSRCFWRSQFGPKFQ